MSVFHYDLCVVGGGINGAAIARDAVGRGLSVVLVEAQDLASGTSSASTKLIHGGLRYLEQGDVRLVRKSLKEREVLLRNARPLIWPIECVLPKSPFVKRPDWMIRFGLFLYDHLGGASVLPKSRKMDRSQHAYCLPLTSDYLEGYIYSDCWCDDSRLVVMNAVDASERGAEILTYTRCVGFEMRDNVWQVTLEDTQEGGQRRISANMIVNAAGPWVQSVLDGVPDVRDDPDLPGTRLVKGSHLILPKQFDGDHAYILPQEDGRVIFVASYQQDYTLVGTTEQVHEADPRDAMISETEADYLCQAYNQYFGREIEPSEALFTYSGIRPLLDDGEVSASRVSRDHLIYHHQRFDAPFLSVFGGKLTTYRLVAQEVVDKLMRLSGNYGNGWTSRVPLHGMSVGKAGMEAFIRQKRAEYLWLPEVLVQRYAYSYGARMDYFLADLEDESGLGVHCGDGVYVAELCYLKEREFARTVEDVVWRRSKLGLQVSEETLKNIEHYFLGGFCDENSGD